MWSLLIIDNYHTYDGVTPDLFQLSQEDVHAFGENEMLREALVPMNNLYVTGELGEGIELYVRGVRCTDHLTLIIQVHLVACLKDCF